MLSNTPQTETTGERDQIGLLRYQTQELVEDVRKAGLADEAKAVWASQGAEFGTLNPQQYGSFVSAEIRRWETVVKLSGAKLE